MPPRMIVVAILALWLFAIGWMFQRDLWPQLRPGDPPPYTIDLVDEARQHALPIHWLIFHGDSKIGDVQTVVSYRSVDDTFDMQSKVARIDLGRIGPLQISATGLASTYRVTRAGALREMLIEGILSLQGVGVAVDAKLNIDGKIDGNRFAPVGTIELANHKENLQLEPVEVSARGSILNPLHPVNRITGLRPGQHWRLPLVDPLTDSVEAMVQKNPALQVLAQRAPRARILAAEVADESKPLHWEQRDVPCLVIEYRQDDFLARTWVRQSDGLVLRQEASIWGEKVVLERE
jgi:hypothetical protein